MAKKKFGEFEKAKLVYSAELLLFAILFCVLSILFLVNVLQVSTWKKWVFLVGGSLGAIWFIVDWIWTLASPKHRKKSSLFDKILLIPSGLAALGFNIYFWISKLYEDNSPAEPVFRMFLIVMLFYFSAVYIAEAIYHWFIPVPDLMEAEKVSKEEEKKEAEAPSQETSPEVPAEPAQEESKDEKEEGK